MVAVKQEQTLKWLMAAMSVSERNIIYKERENIHFAYAYYL